MVHSGPFNGLCEIESSRGSPGISNIFLPMLLRTTSPPSHLPVENPLPPWLLRISPSSLYATIRRRQHILIDPRNLRQGSRRERLAADANGFPNFRNRGNARAKRYPLPEFFLMLHIISAVGVKKNIEIWSTCDPFLIHETSLILRIKFFNQAWIYMITYLKREREIYFFYFKIF